ncbi:MAG: apolipoprotein N-acyltransferase [Candidatus Omnitrophica bacterium]|nr:apolipoprotein N-acyltransferase [Candidatus Omnitrophota bacterium]
MGACLSVLLSALTGILIAISVTYNGIFAWVAFVPGFFVLSKASIKESLAYGIIAGVVATALLFSGVMQYGVTYYVVIIIYNALQGALTALCYCLLLKKIKNPLLNIFIPPSIWVFFEYLKTIGPISFPAPIGTTQYQFTPLIQLASITGVYGVSLVVLWVNRVLTEVCIETVAFIKNKKLNLKNTSHVISAGLIVSLILLVAIGYGNNLLEKNPIKESGIKVSLLQGNIPIESYQKQVQFPEVRDSISQRYFEMTESALKNEKPDILVWPEGAVYEKVLELDAYKQKLLKLAKISNTLFVIGAPGTSTNGYNTNSAYVVSSQGEISGRYDKVRLIPFIENYQAGKGYFPIPTDLGNFGIVICFESTYPQILRRATLNGADILFILTNDCGLIKSSLAYMHANDSVLRAVENRRYVVRADQSGTSLIIDPFGRILKSNYTKEKNILSGIVNTRNDKTLYSLYGDYLPFIPLFLSCLVFLKK